MKHFRPLAVMLMSALLAAGTAAAADGKFGADRHAAMGLTCEACHGPDKANPATPDIKTCTQCHNTKDLVEKTKDVKPTNPHVSPHYQDQLDCTNCHYMHGETENFCDQCHQFGFTAKRRTSATSAISSASRCRKPQPVPSGSFRNIQPSESTDSDGFSVHACRS